MHGFSPPSCMPSGPNLAKLPAHEHRIILELSAENRHARRVRLCSSRAQGACLAAAAPLQPPSPHWPKPPLRLHW